MARWQALYWGEGGVELYDVKNDGLRRLFSGAIDALEPSGKRPMPAWPVRRVLIVGRSNFIRLRKKYPPGKPDQLSRAVAVEAPELFPLAAPVLHCRIAETYPTHVLLDIWAWEREPLDRLKAAFPFRYAVPEDLAFLAFPPMIHIYGSGSMTHLVACGGGRFFDAFSCQGADFSAGDVEKFRVGLGAHSGLMQETRIYGEDLLKGSERAGLHAKEMPGRDCPLPLAVMAASAFNFKSFRSAQGAPPFMNRAVLQRLALYGAAAYGLGLFLTLGSYDRALQESQVLSKTLDREIARIDSPGSGDRGDPEAFQEYREKLKADMSPLRVLDILASDLPEGSYLKSLSIHEGSVETVVLSRDPLMVIKRLGGSGKIGRVSLKGSPARDSATGAYSCALLLEMKP